MYFYAKWKKFQNFRLAAALYFQPFITSVVLLFSYRRIIFRFPSGNLSRLKWENGFQILKYIQMIYQPHLALTKSDLILTNYINEYALILTSLCRLNFLYYWVISDIQICCCFFVNFRKNLSKRLFLMHKQCCYIFRK